MSEHQLKNVKIYSPGGSTAGFVAVFKSLVAEFPQAHGLGLRLALRNRKSRNRQSILGPFWAFLSPIATSIVWIFLRSQGVVEIENLQVSYPVFVIIGITVWQVFTTSIMLTLQTIQSNKSLFTKISFPRESIVVTSFYEILFKAIISLLIIFGTLIIAGHGIHLSVVAALAGVLMLILAGMAVALFLLPISLLFSDVQSALPLALQFIMYLTPVIYPRPLVSQFDWLFRYNPLSYLVTFSRNQFIGIISDVSYSQFALLSVGILVAFSVMLIVYRITLEVLIERMGS